MIGTLLPMADAHPSALCLVARGLIMPSLFIWALVSQMGLMVAGFVGCVQPNRGLAVLGGKRVGYHQVRLIQIGGRTMPKDSASFCACRAHFHCLRW